MTLETLSFLIHGPSKSGKSTLGATAPAPVLILDAEGSTKFLPIAKVEWDPISQAPPIYDGTWTHCIVVVRAFVAYIARHDFTPFGWYRIGAGVVMLALLASGTV